MTVTFELFQPAAFGAGETEAVIPGGPGAVTVSCVENANPTTEAVIVALPVFIAVAKPLATVATLGLDDSHVTDVVTGRLTPSEYRPVTVNCRVAPRGMEGFCGVITPDTKAGAVTDRTVDPVTPAKLALTVVVP